MIPKLNSIVAPASRARACIDRRCRIVALDEISGALALIALDTHERVKEPFYLHRDLLASQLADGSLTTEAWFAPGVPTTEAGLGEAGQARLKDLRPHFEALFSPESRQSLIFDPEHRRRVLGTLCTQLPSTKRNADGTPKIGLSLRQVQRYFNWILWSGDNLMVLGCNFHRSGGRGVDQRKQTKNGKKATKRGRPSATALSRPQIGEALEAGARKFYFGEGLTRRNAYWKTIAETWPEAGIWRKDKRGGDWFDIINKKGVPTKVQFRYAVRKLLNAGLKARVDKPTNRLPAEEKRASRGSPSRDVTMPGERVEVDASKLQIRTVSTLGRDRLLSSLTPYVAYDVFSRAPIGYVLSSEAPSMQLGLALLDSCARPKSEAFRRLGLPYTDDDWPSLLPTILVVDRGEFASDKANHVVTGGTVIHVTPSMSPWLKGTVESAWDRLKDNYAEWRTPGVHSKTQIRRQDDGIDDACLIPSEVERRMVQLLMHDLRSPAPRQLIPPAMVAEGAVNVSKGELLKWGLRHRAGGTRTLDEQERMTHLMMPGVGTVTGAGIKFKRQLFASDVLRGSGLTDKAARGHYKIDIRFHEHLADWIWFTDPVSGKWQAAENDNSHLRNLKLTFAEAFDYARLVGELGETTADSAAVRAIADAEEARAIERGASAKTKKARNQPGVSKARMKRERKANTKSESLLKQLTDDHKIRQEQRLEAGVVPDVPIPSTPRLMPEVAESVAAKQPEPMPQPPPRAESEPGSSATSSIALGAFRRNRDGR